MRGISFKLNEKLDKCLYSILLGLDLENLEWFIDEDEVYQNNPETIIMNNFFDEHILKGKSLLDKIKNEPHYVIFLRLAGFINESSIQVINNYSEFLKNENCSIVVLVCDSIYFDIYCKRTPDIEMIKNNVTLAGCSDIKYITDKNDTIVTFNY